MNNDWRRTPGEGVYARPERERRFLVQWQPKSEELVRQIEDRYVTGTRLRLRKVTVGNESIFKLTQKVRLRRDDPAEISLTNVYLDEDEFGRLAGLDCALLSKSRRFCDLDGVRFAVDEYHGPLEGLLLAEVEVADLDQVLPATDWLGEEVTHNDQYSGGRLARLDAAEIAALRSRGR